MDEITGSSPSELQSVRLLAEFLASPAKRDSVLDKLDKMVSTGFNPEDASMIIIAGTIYNHAQNYENALRVLHQGDHLEW